MSRVTLACRFAVCCAAIAIMLSSRGECDAQSVYSADVQAAAYDRAAAAPAPGQAIRFNRRAPLVGDQLEQHLSVTLQLDTMVRQNNEVLERSKTALRRHQRRTVTTTHVTDGTARSVLVRYAEAAKRVAAGPNADKLEAVQSTPQPVEGKTYRCSRDGKVLLISDEQGGVPPLDEYEIVALNMESLGRPNPLADFLAGQSLTIGQRIVLPNDVAEKLLGLGGEMGQVSRFELTLQNLKQINGHPCAEFLASIEAESNDSSQMRLAVEGPLAIEIDTCRAVVANFTGPIGISETRGSLSATYQMTGTGKMTVSIASRYDDSRR